MLLSKGKLPAPAAAAFTAKLMAVAARAVQEGFDARRGGVYEAGVPGAAAGEGVGASTDKVGGSILGGCWVLSCGEGEEGVSLKLC